MSQTDAYSAAHTHTHTLIERESEPQSGHLYHASVGKRDGREENSVRQSAQ